MCAVNCEILPKNQAIKRFTIHTTTPTVGREKKTIPTKLSNQKNTENEKENKKNGLAKVLMYRMLIHHKGTEVSQFLC